MDCVFFFVVVGLQLDTSVLPQWLKALLTEKFFNACLIHEDAKKNEKNVFCLDCFEGICPHCLPPHSSHRLLQVPLFFSFFFKLKFTRISFNSLRDIYIHTYICMEFISFLFVCYNVIQIRRYVYHDVLRLDDAEKLMDCDFVQVSWLQQTIYELIWEFQGFYLIVNFSFFFSYVLKVIHNQPGEGCILESKASNKDRKRFKPYLLHMWKSPSRKISFLLPLLQGLHPKL